MPAEKNIADAAFDALDARHDGVITREEIQGAVQQGRLKQAARQEQALGTVPDLIGSGGQPSDEHRKSRDPVKMEFSTDPSFTFDSEPSQRFRSEPRTSETFTLDREKASETCFDRPYVKFEGRSSSHEDYVAPPRDTLKRAFDERDTGREDVDSGHINGCRPPEFQAGVMGRRQEVQIPAVQFSGESTSRSDYRPPPLDALKEPLAAPRRPPGELEMEQRAPTRSAGGASCMHYDFRPPATGAQRALMQCSRNLQESRAEMIGAHAHYNTESSMQQHYAPPPLDSLKQNCSATERQRSWFEPCSKPPRIRPQGDAQYSNQQGCCDLDTHPFEAPQFDGDSSTRRDYQPPPVDALINSLAAPKLNETSSGPCRRSGARFEGESSTHHDFRSPLMDVFGKAFESHDGNITFARDAERASSESVQFKGESRQGFQPPPLEHLRSVVATPKGSEGCAGHQSRPAARFEGESVNYTDYQAPSREALRRAVHSEETHEKMTPCFDKASGQFHGASSTHGDYQQPPLQALRRVLDEPRVADTLFSRERRFEGESSTHYDFRAPSLGDLRRALHITDQTEHQKQELERPAPVRFEGESSMQHDYQAPPLNALREASGAPKKMRVVGEPRLLSGPVAKFEGESSTRRDFQAPSLEALRRVLHSAKVQEVEKRDPQMPARAHFDSESSMRQDYQAPPLNVSRGVSQVPQVSGEHDDRQNEARPVIKFEGESSTHHDFQAPSMEALRRVLNVADEREHQKQDIERPASARFEGESSMRQDYQAPPIDALRRVLNAPQVPEGLGEQVSQSRPAAKFEGESSAHRDFQAPSMEALRRILRAADAHDHQKQDFERLVPVRFEGESSMQQDYQAPPMDALRKVLAGVPQVKAALGERQSPSKPAAKFEGESETHRAFQAPTMEALRRALNLADEREHQNQDFERPASVRFEGESSMRQDYQAPPMDALRRVLDAPQVSGAPGEQQPLSRPAAKFEGESSTHRDFQAPSMEALRRVLNAAEQHEHQKQGVEEPAPPRFVGESSMRQDYQAPPMDALRRILDAPQVEGGLVEKPHSQSRPAAKFEGESSTHRDFQAPSMEALRRALDVADEHEHQNQDFEKSAPARFEGESSMRQDYQAPPMDALRRALDAPQVAEGLVEQQSHPRPAAKFEAESSTHRDFQAPSLEALRRVLSVADEHENQKQDSEMPAPARFDGESSMRQDYQAPPMDALREMLDAPQVAGTPRQQQPLPRPTTKFEGESSTHRDFQAPSLEALRRVLNAADEREHSKQDSERPAPARFEGESSMRQDYQAPPLDALRRALDAPENAEGLGEQHSQFRTVAKLEGQSSSHQDYQAPSMEALRRVLDVADENERQNQNFHEPAPARFEGESSMRQDYQAPPMDALRKVLDAPQHTEGLGEQQSHSRPAAKFEGESSTHRDFQAPSLEALRRVLNASNEDEHRKMKFEKVVPARFEGESSMRQDYQAPPMDALRRMLDMPQAAGVLGEQQSQSTLTAKFEGESSTHHDFQAPSMEALRRVLNVADERERLKQDFEGPAPARFEGESSMRQDYQAPPMDALRRILDAPQVAGGLGEKPPSRARPAAKFEGESSTHRDFQAPSMEALRRALNVAYEHEHQNQDFEKPAPARFEGESSMRQDYQAPPMDALRRVLDTPQVAGWLGEQRSQSKPAAKFEGESSTRHDFQAPSKEALHRVLTVVHERHLQKQNFEKPEQARFEGESSMRQDYQAPPMDALRRVLDAPQAAGGRAEQQSQSRPSAKFEGESSTHRDFPAPSMEALRRVLQVVAGHDRQNEDADMPPPPHFEGESSMRKDYQAPPMDALRRTLDVPPVDEPQVQSRPSAKFEGASSTHRDFQAPSLAALRRASHITDEREQRTRDSDIAVPARFEGESSMRQDYQAPPLDALKRGLDVPQGPGRLDMPRSQSRPISKFEGESSTHNDFQAPSLEALRSVLRIADGQGQGKQDPQMPAPARFQGESSIRLDYQAPSTDSVHRALSAPRDSNTSDRPLSQSGPAARFVGESSSHRDYQAPSLEAVCKSFDNRGQQQQQQQHRRQEFEMPAPVRFNGESSMRCDYQSPPLDALRGFLDASRSPRLPCETQSQPKPAVKFEGESSTHRDYQAPSREDYQASHMDALQNMLPAPKNQSETRSKSRPTFKFEGESSTHHDFQAPPREALGAALHEKDRQDQRKHDRSVPAVHRFEGESSMRHDYQAPPSEALRGLAVAPKEPVSQPRPAAKFEGESSTHRDFQAPPTDTLQAASRTSDEPRPARPTPMRFEGESSMRHDYQAHNIDHVRNGMPGPQVPPALREQNLRARPAAKFHGESSTHRDFRNPSQEAFHAISHGSAARQRERQESMRPADAGHEGESSMRRDYVAPPKLTADLFWPAHNFEGESSMQRDSHAPLVNDRDNSRSRFQQPAEPCTHLAARSEDIPPAPHDDSRIPMRETKRADGELPSCTEFRLPLAASPAACREQPMDCKQNMHAKFEAEACMHPDLHSLLQDSSQRIAGQASSPKESQSSQRQTPLRVEGESTLDRNMRPLRPGSAPFASTVSKETRAGNYKARATGRRAVSLDSNPRFLARFKDEPSSHLHASQMAGESDESQGTPRRNTTRFEGESSMHHDFQPPHLKAFQKSSDQLRPTNSSWSNQARFEEESSLHASCQPVSMRCPNASRRHLSSDCNPKMSSLYRDFQPQQADATRWSCARAEDLEETRQTPRRDRPSFQGQSTTHHDFRPPPCNQLDATIPLGARPFALPHSRDRSGAQQAVEMLRERCSQPQRQHSCNEPTTPTSCQKRAAGDLCMRRGVKDNQDGGWQESPRRQGSIAAAATACFDADTAIRRSHHQPAAASPRRPDPSQGGRCASEARRVHILKTLPRPLSGQDTSTQRKEGFANDAFFMLDCNKDGVIGREEIREAVVAGKLLRQRACKDEAGSDSLSAGVPSRVRRGSMPPRQGSLGASRHAPESSSTAQARRADSATWSPNSTSSTVRTSAGSRIPRAAPKFEGESSTHRDFRPPPAEALREAFRPPQQRPRSAPAVRGTGRYNRQ